VEFKVGFAEERVWKSKVFTDSIQTQSAS
jgi:hypothetical protein